MDFGFFNCDIFIPPMEKEHKNIPQIKKGDLVMLFDGICRLCNIWAKFIIRFDKKTTIKFVPMQSKKGKAILQLLEYPTTNYETILFIEKNITYDKSSAVFRIIHHLPFPIKILTVFQYVPSVISDFIYTLIAKNRYKLFSKLGQCSLPKSEQKSRYL